MKKRTMYSMHHTWATIGRVGYITPFLRLDVCPGDTWSGKVGMLMRFSPLKRALLMDMYVDQYVFYVPWRLVWDQWEDFISAGPNNPSIPAVPAASGGDTALMIPSFTGETHSKLYRRAYNLCYNEFFRDELLTPLGADTIPALGSPGSEGCAMAGPKRHWLNELRDDRQTGVDAVTYVRSSATGTTWPGVAVPGAPVVVQAADVLRSIAEQKLQMRRATYGTRYVDILKSYGVRVNYSMLQKPEIVATAHGSVNITDVVATGGELTEVGYLKGHAIQGSRINFRRKSFSEHGCLLGVVVVRPPFVSATFRDYLDTDRGYDGFYDPALELLPTIPYEWDRLLANPVATDVVKYGPWGQWYRGAMSRCHPTLVDWCIEHCGRTAPVGLADMYDCGLMQPDADEAFADVSQGHYQVSAVNGLKVLRLIARGTGIAGVGG